MVVRHGMRNALLPVVTVIGLSLGGFLSGAVLTETIFNLTGIGQDAVRGDHRAATTSSSRASPSSWRCIYLVVNLIVDVSYAFLDPRIRLS